MKTSTVLVVDDNSDDLLLLKLACKAASPCFQMRAADGGEAGIAYLESSRVGGTPEVCPLPQLVLLDLKMPGMSGFDVLAWLRSQREFAHLPVAILTSSIHPEDRARAMEMGADHFFVKPVGYEGLQDLVRTIEDLVSRKLPPGEMNDWRARSGAGKEGI